MTTAGQSVLLCLGAATLLVAAGLFVSVFRLRSAIAFLLAMHLTAWALVVIMTLLLSPLHAVRRATTFGWLTAALVIATVCWIAQGRPAPPLGGLRRSLHIALSDRSVQLLVTAAGIGFAYVTALTVATPENEGDSLAYHVARAAFWYQNQSVGYVENAIETRLNVNPPNAEIGNLFTMLLSGSQRFVGLVQILALLACVLAAVGIARRTGAGLAAAMWAGLLLVTFPVVITQAWTAQNDVVVAAFLATAVYFLLGESRTEFILAGLALGLGIGAKFTAVLSIPVLLLVLAAAPGGRRLAKAGWMLGLGAAVGSIWYIVNLVETGSLDGGLAGAAKQTPGSVDDVVFTLRRFLLDAFDLSGLSSGLWRWDRPLGLSSLVYRIVGMTLLLVGLLLLARRRRTADAVSLCSAGLLVAIAPSLVAAAYRVVYFTHARSLDIALVANTTAGATPSWYGPLGVIGVVAGIVVAARQVGRRLAPRIVLFLALSPVALAVSIACTLVWDPWRGRFLIFAFILAVAAWTRMFAFRWLRWSVTAIGIVTLGVVLLNSQSKPLGWSQFQVPPAASVWGQPEWQAQTILRPQEDDQLVLRFAAQRVPPRAHLALAPRGNEFLSPYFGRNLTRTVELVRHGGTVSRDAEWLIAAPGVRPAICGRDWRVLFRSPDRWLVMQRIGAVGDCSSA